MMAGAAVERLLARLDAVKPNGADKWRARCPVHDDKRPSLDIAQGDGAAVLVCRSCGANGAAVCEHFGLPVAALFDSFDEQATRPKRQASAPRVTIGSALASAADAGPETLDAALKYMCDAALAGTEQPPGNGAEPAARGAEPVELRELLSTDMPPREWLLEGLLQQRDLAMIHAFRGIGKSRFVHGLAVAVAAGSSFLRFRAPHPAGVLLVDGELPREDLQAMLAQAVATAGSVPTAPLRVLSADLSELPVYSLATERGRKQVEQYLDGVALLILDSITTLCPGAGSENDAESWDIMQAWLLDLRRRGITVLLIHHDGKGGSQRGTSKREDVLSQVVQLKRPVGYHPREGARFELTFSKSRGLVGEAADPIEAWLQVGAGQDGGDMWTWRPLEDAQAARVAELSAEGLSIRDIAAELGLSKSAVHRALKRATKP